MKGGVLFMATVIIKAQKDEDSRSLISRFRKFMVKENIIEEARERRFHKKPSTLRKEKLAEQRRGKKEY